MEKLSKEAIEGLNRMFSPTKKVSRTQRDKIDEHKTWLENKYEKKNLKQSAK